MIDGAGLRTAIEVRVMARIEDDFSSVVTVYLAWRNEEGVPFRAVPVVGEQINPGELRAEPFLFLKVDDARKLLDQLWSVGIRPTGYRAVSEEDRHLEDLRQIAFRLLEHTLQPKPVELTVPRKLEEIK